MSDDAPRVPRTPATGRVQLALNVENLEASKRFYAELFRVEPVKRKHVYVNFAITEPPLKLILFERGDGGTINHLGVEVGTSEHVSDAIERLEDSEIAIQVEGEGDALLRNPGQSVGDRPRWREVGVLRRPRRCRRTDGGELRKRSGVLHPGGVM